MQNEGSKVLAVFFKKSASHARYESNINQYDKPPPWVHVLERLAHYINHSQKKKIMKMVSEGELHTVPLLQLHPNIVARAACSHSKSNCVQSAMDWLHVHIWKKEARKVSAEEHRKKNMLIISNRLNVTSDEMGHFVLGMLFVIVFFSILGIYLHFKNTNLITNSESHYSNENRNKKKRISK